MFEMRVRAYRFRAYSSKTTARVLETQLEVACNSTTRLGGAGLALSGGSKGAEDPVRFAL